MGVGVHGENKVIGVIPARLNSSRLPGKPLKKIKGYPMIYWVAKQVEKSVLENYMVATDDKKIVNACNFYNIPVKMTSSKCRNGTERVAEISQEFNEDTWFINIQGDEPIINPLAINRLLKEKRSNEDYQFIQAVNLIEDSKLINDINTVKVIFSKNKEVLLYSRLPTFRQQTEKKYFRCLGLYLYSKKFLKTFVNLKPSKRENEENIEQLRAIDNDLKIKACEVEDNGFSVDTIRDLEKMRRVFSKHNSLDKS